MKTVNAQITLGTALIGAFAGFWRWHSPPAKKLTPEEIDHYLELISKLPLPGDEIDKIVCQLRTWAEADDGKPTYMLNLIRYFPELHRFPGAPEFDGTPEEANAYYEKECTPMWLKAASYPMLGGKAQGENLIKTLPDQPPWSTAQMVRYPSRRTFLKLLSDPSYAPLEPFKFMALEIDLVPVSGDRQIPDARWIVGGALLTLFLVVGWIRAVRGQSFVDPGPAFLAGWVLALTVVGSIVLVLANLGKVSTGSTPSTLAYVIKLLLGLLFLLLAIRQWRSLPREGEEPHAQVDGDH